MAEFHSGGLSAVSAFFGVNKKQEHAEHSTSSAQQTASSRGRHGVGSTSAKKQVKSTSEDTIGRVLKVGKRKRSAEEHDDDDSASHQSDDNEQEEEGRTAIAEKSKAPSDAAGAVEANQPKKKKKKGKKERQAEQAADNLQAAQHHDAYPVQAESQDTAAEEHQKTKRKRHKVRSRQKNIYKDKRLTQHKPGHLIPGRAEFHGRPMTAETRAKLNLPPSKSSRHHHESEDAHHIDQTSSTAEGVKLAIDDLLDHDETGTDVGIGADGIKKKKKKKRKKPKYKNLQ